MKIKHVHLRNFNINKDVTPFKPNKDIEIKWHQSEELKKNNETYASFIGDNKTEINNQLSLLSKNIMSDRLRTVRGIPKCRIIKTNVKREVIKEIY